MTAELWGFPRWLIAATAALLAVKAWFAATLDLFGDGAFYWLEARNLAFAYSDLPPATALVIRAGVELFGDTPFGVRAWFLIVAAAPPFVIYRWARELGTRQDANWAAALGLSIPMIATLGVLAVPDVLQVTVGLTACYTFERATRADSNGLAAWILTGLLVGIGLTVHYRFAIVPIAMAAYLFSAPRGLALLRTPAPWVAAMTASPGLAPIVWFNLEHAYAGFGFQFVDRHPWSFDPQGLLFWTDQLLATTPLLYVLLLLVAIRGLTSRRSADDRPYLLAVIGLTHVLLYGIASPWMDHQRTNVHWPLLGYLALALLTPRECARLFGTRANLVLGGTTLVASAVALGLLASLLLMTRYGDLPRDIRAPLVSKLSGHREIASHVSERRQTEKQPILTGQYYLAAQLRFAFGSDAPVYLLTEEKADRDGRALQLGLWHMRLEHLPLGQNALLVIERTAWSDPEYDAMLTEVCARFRSVTPHGTHAQFEGERVFRFFDVAGGSIAPLDRRQHESPPCRPMSRVYVDRGYPRAFDTLSGTLTAEGWAFQDDGGVETVELLVNGKHHAPVTYGLARPDVAAFFTSSTDPNHPMVGFRAQWDVSTLPARVHDIRLRVTSRNGNVEDHWRRPFRIASGPQR